MVGSGGSVFNKVSAVLDGENVELEFPKTWQMLHNLKKYVNNFKGL